MKRISLVLFLLSILGSLTGYLRELGMATTFGAGKLTDVYFVAASIPMVIGDLIFGSVLTACIVPVVSRLRADEGTNSSCATFLNEAMMLIVLFGIFIAVAVTAVMPQLVGLLAPGFDENTQKLLAHYAYWLIWLLPINAILLLANLALNAYRVFVLPAMTWVVINLIFFLIIIFGHEYFGPECLIWAAMCGPLLMLCVNLWQLNKNGLLLLEKPRFDTPAFHNAILLAKPVLLTFGIGSGLGLLMISHVILRTYGSHTGEGAVSALGYAFRIYEVPISLVTSTVGVLVLPVFSTLYHQGEHDKLAQIGRDLLGWGWLILLPMALMLYVFAGSLIHLLFHGGAFKGSAVQQTTLALQGFAPALLFETVLMIFFRMFYGIRRPGIAVGIGIASLLTLFMVLEFIDQPRTVEGLAIAFSASFGVAAVLCIAGMVYFLGASMLPQKRELILPLVITVIATGAFLLWQHSTQITPSDSVIAVAGFSVSYIAVLWKFLPERADALTSQIKSVAIKLF